MDDTRCRAAILHIWGIAKRCVLDEVESVFLRTSFAARHLGVSPMERWSAIISPGDLRMEQVRDGQIPEGFIRFVFSRGLNLSWATASRRDAPFPGWALHAESRTILKVGMNSRLAASTGVLGEGPDSEKARLARALLRLRPHVGVICADTQHQRLLVASHHHDLYLAHSTRETSVIEAMALRFEEGAARCTRRVQ